MISCATAYFRFCSCYSALNPNWYFINFAILGVVGDYSINFIFTEDSLYVRCCVVCICCITLSEKIPVDRIEV